MKQLNEYLLPVINLGGYMRELIMEDDEAKATGKTRLQEIFTCMLLDLVMNVENDENCKGFLAAIENKSSNKKTWFGEAQAQTFAIWNKYFPGTIEDGVTTDDKIQAICNVAKKADFDAIFISSKAKSDWLPSFYYQAQKYKETFNGSKKFGTGNTGFLHHDTELLFKNGALDTTPCGQIINRINTGFKTYKRGTKDSYQKADIYAVGDVNAIVSVFGENPIDAENMFAEIKLWSDFITDTSKPSLMGISLKLVGANVGAHVLNAVIGDDETSTDKKILSAVGEIDDTLAEQISVDFNPWKNFEFSFDETAEHTFISGKVSSAIDFKLRWNFADVSNSSDTAITKHEINAKLNIRSSGLDDEHLTVKKSSDAVSAPVVIELNHSGAKAQDGKGTPIIETLFGEFMREKGLSLDSKSVSSMYAAQIQKLTDVTIKSIQQCGVKMSDTDFANAIDKNIALQSENSNNTDEVEVVKQMSKTGTISQFLQIDPALLKNLFTAWDNIKASKLIDVNDDGVTVVNQTNSKKNKERLQALADFNALKTDEEKFIKQFPLLKQLLVKFCESIKSNVDINKELKLDKNVDTIDVNSITDITNTLNTIIGGFAILFKWRVVYCRALIIFYCIFANVKNKAELAAVLLHIASVCKGINFNDELTNLPYLYLGE